MTDEQSSGVMLWWAALCVVSMVNICAWTLEVVRAKNDESTWRIPRGIRWWKLALSALFVLGCAFRSALPRAEGQRFVMYDWWLSSAFIGRSVATVAELALVAQLSIVLWQYSKGVGLRFGVVASRFLLPMIVIAEICSWYSALTTNFIGSVFEESIWATTAALMAVVLVKVWQRHVGAGRRFALGFMSTAIALDIAYVVFMCTVDIPMYFKRWRTDQAQGRQYLSVQDGWRDSQQRRVLTRRWEDWRQEIPWMSLYFSAGVWISIAFIRTPAAADQAADQAGSDEGDAGERWRA